LTVATRVRLDSRSRATEVGVRVRQFVVGTGGSTYEELPHGDAAANREAGQDRSFGVLKMTLLDGGYDWEFVTAPGEDPYRDAGHAGCV